MEVKAELRSPPSSEWEPRTLYLQVGADWRVFLGKHWFSVVARKADGTHQTLEKPRWTRYDDEEFLDQLNHKSELRTLRALVRLRARKSERVKVTPDRVGCRPSATGHHSRRATASPGSPAARRSTRW